MDSVRSGPFGQIFRPDNFVFGESPGPAVSCVVVFFRFLSVSPLLVVVALIPLRSFDIPFRAKRSW